MSLARDLEPLIRRWATEATNTAANGIADRIRKAAPVHKADPRDPRPRSGGRLRDSIKTTRARSRGSEVSATVETDVEYASFQDTGTKGPYMIFPRKPGGRLVFFWPKVGSVVALRQVRHPGIRNPSQFWKKNTRSQDWLAALRAAATRTSVRG